MEAREVCSHPFSVNDADQAGLANPSSGCGDTKLVYGGSQVLVGNGLGNFLYDRPAAFADFDALPVTSMSYFITLI
jgi:hypothetical protein